MMNVAHSSGLCNTGTEQTTFEIGDVAAASLLTLICHALERSTMDYSLSFELIPKVRLIWFFGISGG